MLDKTYNISSCAGCIGRASCGIYPCKDKKHFDYIFCKYKEILSKLKTKKLNY